MKVNNVSKVSIVNKCEKKVTSANFRFVLVQFLARHVLGERESRHASRPLPQGLFGVPFQDGGFQNECREGPGTRMADDLFQTLRWVSSRTRVDDIR